MEKNYFCGKGKSIRKAKSWGANTDIIFYYTKTDDFQLLPLEKIDSQKYTKEIEKLFPKIDSKGEKYNTFVPLYCSKSMGARPNLCYEWRGFKNLHPSGWRLSKERMEEEYKKGNIVIGKMEKLNADSISKITKASP